MKSFDFFYYAAELLRNLVAGILVITITTAFLWLYTKTGLFVIQALNDVSGSSSDMSIHMQTFMGTALLTAFLVPVALIGHLIRLYGRAHRWRR